MLSRTSSVVGLVPLGRTSNSARLPSRPRSSSHPHALHPAETAGRGRGSDSHRVKSRSSPFPRRGVRGARVSELRMKRAEYLRHRTSTRGPGCTSGSRNCVRRRRPARPWLWSWVMARDVEAVFEQASMLYERDMMVFHANQTLQTFGRRVRGTGVRQTRPHRFGNRLRRTPRHSRRGVQQPRHRLAGAGGGGVLPSPCREPGRPAPKAVALLGVSRCSTSTTTR